MQSEDVSQRFRVLIVEDSEEDTMLLVRELRRGTRAVAYERVDAADKFAAALDREPWDLVLADYNLPQFSAPAALAMVQARKLDVPFIVVSGAVGEETAADLLRAGAHDFILKGKYSRLLPAIERELEAAGGRRAQARAEQALRASESRYRRLFESAPVGIGITLPGGEVLSANRWILDLVGCRLDELQEEGWARLYHNPEEFSAQLRELEQGAPVRNWEVRLRRRDGAVFQALINVDSIELDGRRVLLATVRDIEERRQAERALHRSEERHRAFIAHSSEAIWCLELEAPLPATASADEQVDHLYEHGYVAEANAVMAGLHGFSGPAEVTGKRLGQILPRLAPQDVTLLRAFIQAKHRLTEVESCELDQQGRVKYFLSSLLGVRDEDEVARIWIVKRDVSERRAFEEEIRRLNRLYAVLSQINQAIVRTDSRQGVFQAVCRVAIEFGAFRLAYVLWPEETGGPLVLAAEAGVAAGEQGIEKLEGRPGDSDYLGLARRAVRAGETCVVNDFVRGLRPEARAEFARCAGLWAGAAFPIRVEGRVEGALAVYAEEPSFFQDRERRLLEEVTLDLEFAVAHLAREAARRRAERRLEEQARLLDLAQDAIIVCDLEARVVYWNHGAERLYGWTAAEMANRALPGGVCRDPDRFAQARREVLATGQWSGEVRHYTKDDRVLDVISRWTLLRGEQGEPRSVLSINTDLTEHKRLEAQFLRSQRLESIGLLASGVAHDLNNILTPILMSAPLLRSAAMRPEDHEVLDAIQTNAERGASIVKQLLTFGRGVVGERVVVQVRHLAREVVTMARETFPRQIALREEYGRDLWPVVGDATQIHQVLLNLCVNARDAMPTGGTLTVRLANVDVARIEARLPLDAKPGRYVRLEVTDTGTGIVPEHLDKIFDPFFTTKELGHGTGLGLSTVLGIVKAHGGFLDLSTVPGQGSTFRVYLPARPDLTLGVEGRTPPDEELPHAQGELVLVVDDEPQIRQLVRATLLHHGYTVETATDGADAMVMYTQRRGQVRAVITDIMMPIMDGMSLVRALRRTDPRLPVIASSGLGSGLNDAKRSELRALGGTIFLDKPYTARVLLQTLHRVLHP